MLKLSIRPETTARTVIEFIEEKTVLKDQRDPDQKTVLFYVDDVHLANE